VTGGTVVAILACILTVMTNLIIIAFYAGKLTTRLTQLEGDVKLLRKSLHDLRNAITALMLGHADFPDDDNGTSLTTMVTRFVSERQQKTKAASTTA